MWSLKADGLYIIQVVFRVGLTVVLPSSRLRLFPCYTSRRTIAPTRVSRIPHSWIGSFLVTLRNSRTFGMVVIDRHPLIEMIALISLLLMESH